MTGGRVARFRPCRSGASAVEFALVAAPFVFTLLGILQVGVFYVAQSALDTGVVRVADSLRNGFTAAGTPAMPSASSLKTSVSGLAGAMIRNDSSLSVEIRQLATLGLGTTPVTDGVADYGTPSSALVLRAEATVVTFAPFLSSLARTRSSAIVRRQGR